MPATGVTTRPSEDQVVAGCSLSAAGAERFAAGPQRGRSDRAAARPDPACGDLGSSLSLGMPVDDLELNSPRELVMPAGQLAALPQQVAP
jgi:hypothetical protein